MSCSNCGIVRRGKTFPVRCFECGRIVFGERLEQLASDILSQEYGKDHPAAGHNFTITFRTTTHAHQVRELAEALRKEGDSRAAEMLTRATNALITERLEYEEDGEGYNVLGDAIDVLRALPLTEAKGNG